MLPEHPYQEVPTRKGSFDANAIGMVAFIVAGFIVLTTLVLRPDYLEGRLLAVAIGVVLSVLTLLLSPRRKALATDTAPQEEELLQQLEQHGLLLEEVRRAGRQQTEEIRYLRTRLTDLERRGEAVPYPDSDRISSS